MFLVITIQSRLSEISERFVPEDNISVLYFFLEFSMTKSALALLGLYPLCRLGTFPLVAWVMFEDLGLHRGASQLQTASACVLSVLI
jgi:hypothetical protein